MLTPPVPDNEAARLRMLQSLDLVDQPKVDIFADYVALTAQLLDAPTALISLIDETRQWFAGSTGLNVGQTDRSISFCGHAINQPEALMWVPDAHQDPRFFDNPLVTGGPRIRFYAGAPLVVHGLAVGTLCVLAPAPRPFDPAQAQVLRGLARLLAERLEKRHRDHALQRALAIAVDAIIECDEWGTITDWCEGAARLFGFSKAEAIGQAIDIIIPPELREAHAAGLTRWREGGMAPLLNRLELAAVNRDGGFIDVELSLSSWRSHGRPVISTTVRDISARKAQAASLVKAKMDAEAASLTKTTFLANISHEIRTPLNGVVGVVGLLAATALTPEQTEMVDIMRRAADQLQRLLGDVLDIARIESGRFTLAEESVSIEQIVSEAADLCAMKARAKGLEFAVQIDPGARTVVKADPVRLKQVLINLISNAVKFTDVGFVKVAVSARAGRYRFEVQDSGIGFGEEERAVIFSRFEQAENSIAQRFGGTGLGLAICRELAVAMGGAIDCRGSRGEGATFWFEAPLPTESSEVQDDVALESPEIGALTVLLADDNATNRRVAELIMASMGASVVSTANGAEACRAFKAGAFDLVLMDMMMPVMDGVDAVRAIRAFEVEQGLGRTPVIMLTANTLPEHIERSLNAGADLHVPKPVTSTALLTAISSALDATIV